MKTRNIIAIVLLVLSFVVLVPGLIRPLITINASVSVLGQEMEVFSDTRSIVQTVQSLHESGNNFVAGLILLFSILVPFIKGILLILSMVLGSQVARFRLFTFVRNISKWSMADVFVVGVYVAFLSARATTNLDAQVHSGFYLFAAYCLISLISLQFMHIEDPRGEIPDSLPETARMST
ncbi:MAG: paraquat-inducible protein A [Longimicrobiales bacterium]|nr:paraquat-inducible protein A [Longimicrobiales bacterium]